MHMYSAAGEVLRPVLVLALKTMPVDEFFVADVKGLGFHTGKTVGRVYVCKTRCGTGAMWHDWFTKYCLPELKASDEYHETKDEWKFFSTDGEDVIISNIWKNDLTASFTNQKVHYGRVGAGITGIHNACDRAVVFRDSKKCIAEVRKAGTDFTSEVLRRSMILFW